MVTSTKDALTRIREARAQLKSSSSKFFFMKDGETAHVHVMRNLDDMCVVNIHRGKYDAEKKRFEPFAVCAQEFGKECVHCADKNLTPIPFCYLPIYVHKKIGADGQERKLESLLYLEMHPSDGILIGLEAAAEEGDLTECDFVIRRFGSGSATKYTVNPRRGSPASLSNDITIPTDELIRSDVEIDHPMLAVIDPFVDDLK